MRPDAVSCDVIEISEEPHFVGTVIDMDHGWRAPDETEYRLNPFEDEEDGWTDDAVDKMDAARREKHGVGVAR